MSFSYDLTASGTALAVAYIRLDLGDVTSGAGVRVSGGNFSDEELLAFYGQEASDTRRAAARACESLAREWAGRADTAAGPLRTSYGQISKAWAAQAKTMREQAGGGAATAGAGIMRRADGYAYRAGSVDVTQ